MKAFAILDGGGVKCAALAGCISAARDAGIEFCGFGGTSGGAIVATLAGIGASGQDIRDLFVRELSNGRLLSDGGSLLKDLISFRNHLGSVMSDGRVSVLNLFKLFFSLRSSRSEALRLLWQNGGLYDARALSSLLKSQVEARLPELKTKSFITFSDIEDATGVALKIVAADISTCQAAVFSSEDVTYGTSVIDAVMASASYPYVFRPIQYTGGFLSDGGLASNLPAFLFLREFQQTRYPVFAFDLVAAADKSDQTGAPAMSKRFLSTALEASDALIADAVPGVHRIPVPVPSNIHALHFEISESDIERLYQAGYSSASKFFSKCSLLNNIKHSGERLQARLWATYGKRGKFVPLLWALAKMLEERTGAESVRSQIMLPTGKKTRILVYNYGHRESDTDNDIELGTFAGCTGRSLELQGAVVADLTVSQKQFALWKLSQADQNRIPSDRRSAISVPIFGPNGGPPIATLSADSTSTLKDAGWIRDESGTKAASKEADPDVVEIMTEWSDLLGELLFPSFF